MARVAGVDLPPNKRAQIGLTYIYGIGRSRATSILKEAQVKVDTRVKDLSEDELGRIRSILDTQGEIEGDLRKRVQMDIKRLMAAPARTASTRLLSRKMARKCSREWLRPSASVWKRLACKSYACTAWKKSARYVRICSLRVGSNFNCKGVWRRKKR